MAEYIVTRQFAGSPGVGEKIEIPDDRRADILVRRRYVIPSEGSVTNTEETVARFKGEIERLKVELEEAKGATGEQIAAENEALKQSLESANAELHAVVTKAVSLIAITKLDDFLAVVSSEAALTAAAEAETRDTATPLIEARVQALAAASEEQPSEEQPSEEQPDEGE